MTQFPSGEDDEIPSEKLIRQAYESRRGLPSPVRLGRTAEACGVSAERVLKLVMS